MRKLLIKLVAVETMLVGWLIYWIFLIYANNPSVSAGLSDQLSKFPQLAFTTVDIAVLVVIAAFAIVLAFKFHRGLRPGIRLERALQMLENLMKRNLVLEAQVAELRVEKAPMTPSISSNLPGPSFTRQSSSSLSSSEPRAGSWEKAFRTPLEAGPATPKISSPTASQAPFERETGIPPPRIEPLPSLAPQTIPPLVVPEKSDSPTSRVDVGSKFSDKPSVISSSSSSGWEDSPRYVGESTGILTPSSGPKKIARVSDAGGLREPYIPAPAPRPPPPSVIVGPMGSKPASPGRTTPKPIVRPTFPSKTSLKEPPPVTTVPEPLPSSAPIIIDKPADTTLVDPKPSQSISRPEPVEKIREKLDEKPSEGYKKKPLKDED